MMKFFRRRPSPAMIVGIVALIAAMGGGAYAATKKKVEYKGLSKDARLKVLPFSKSQTSTAQCDPTAEATFTDCLTVNVDGSTGFPRKYYVSFDGIFDGFAGVARGDCRIETDNNPVPGTTIRVEASTHAVAQHGEGAGINVVTPPLGGAHAISVACNQTAGDLRVNQYQLSAFQVR